METATTVTSATVCRDDMTSHPTDYMLRLKSLALSLMPGQPGNQVRVNDMPWPVKIQYQIISAL